MHKRALLYLHFTPSPAPCPISRKNAQKSTALSAFHPIPCPLPNIQKECIKEQCSICIAPHSLPPAQYPERMHKRALLYLHFTPSPAPCPVSRKNARKSDALSAFHPIPCPLPSIQ